MVKPWKGMIPLGGKTTVFSRAGVRPLSSAVTGLLELWLKMDNTSTSRVKHSITCHREKSIIDLTSRHEKDINNFSRLTKNYILYMLWDVPSHPTLAWFTERILYTPLNVYFKVGIFFFYKFVVIFISSYLLDRGRLQIQNIGHHLKPWVARPVKTNEIIASRLIVWRGVWPWWRAYLRSCRTAEQTAWVLRSAPNAEPQKPVIKWNNLINLIDLPVLEPQSRGLGPKFYLSDSEDILS